MLADKAQGVDELVSRTFVGDVLWYIGGAALVGGAGLAINGAIATLAGPAAVGVFNQNFAIYVIAGQVAVGGLQFSTLRAVSQQQRLEHVGPVVVSALLLVVMSAGVAATAILLLRAAIGRALDSAETAAGIVYMFPALALFPINKVMVMALNGLSRMRMVAVFQGLRPLMIIISLIVLLMGHVPTPMLSASLSSAEAVVFAGLAVVLSRHITWGPWDRRVLSDWIASHLFFAFRGALSGIAVEVNTRVDVLILGFFQPDGVVGIYSTAAVVAEAFTLAPAALRANLDPMLGACFATGDTRRISAIAARLRPVMRRLTAAAAPAALLAFPVLLTFFRGAIPVGSTTKILAIMLAGVSISVLYRPFLGLLLQSGRPGAYTLLSAAVLAVNGALCFTLVPILGAYGAAVSVSAAYAAEGLLVVLTARRLGVDL